MNNQVTGNVGLYLVCTELSKKGFNVMPTARNAKGVDIVGYDAQGRSFTVQVKTLTKRNPVPFGKSMAHLPADYYVIAVHVDKEPIYHILTRRELQEADVSKFTGKNGVGYWLEPKNYYRKDEYVKGAWMKIVPT